MTFALIATALIGLILWYIVKFINERQKWNKISEAIGEPPRHFFFGCLPLLPRNDPVGILHTMMSFPHKYGKNGNVVSWGLGNTVVVQVTNPKDVETILNARGVTKSLIYRFISPWLGTGLLTANGQTWADHRKLVTPAFHFKILEEFINVFNENDKKMVKILESKVGLSEFDIHDIIISVTLDSISETSMGIKLNAMDGQNKEYTEAVKDMSEIVFNRLFNPIQRNEFLYRFTDTYKHQKKIIKTLHSFAEEVILKRRTELEKQLSKPTVEEVDEFGVKKRPSLLDLLLQATVNGVPLTNVEIRQEVDTFMFGGHDTTASTLFFLIYRLAIHPEIQENVFQSINELVGSNLDEMPTLSQLQEMKYLEMVIKESMRLHATAPIVGRTLLEPLKISDVEVPKGTEVSILIYALHRSPLLWKNPEEFDPTRFTEDEISKRGPYEYIPFSAGYRNCIGQKFAMLEVKSIIAAILRNFKIVATEKTKQMKYRTSMVLHPVNGVFIKLEKRVY